MAELERFRTSNTVTMTPELFEKLYLGPQNNVKGDLRKTFGNPTPLGRFDTAGLLSDGMERVRWARGCEHVSYHRTPAIGNRSSFESKS
jgi:hypothetical protein